MGCSSPFPHKGMDKLQFVGSRWATEPGTNVLLDLLSIGASPAAQSSQSNPDVLPSVQNDIMSLERLSSPNLLSAQPSLVGAATAMDLLDGLGPTSSLVPEDDTPTHPSVSNSQSLWRTGKKH